MPGAPASVTQVRGGSLRSVAVLQELIALSRERDSRAGPSRDLCWFWMDACAPAPTARYCGQPLPASRAAQPWSLRVRAWGAATCSWALCGDAGGGFKPQLGLPHADNPCPLLRAQRTRVPGRIDAGRVGRFVGPIDPPLYSRRHFITCKFCQPSKLFPLMRASDVPHR